MAAARLQRWALFLSGFSYDIVYKNTKLHGNADGLSRLPVQLLEESSNETIDPLDVYFIDQINENLPVDSKRISQEIRKDTVLARVYE